MAMFSCLSTKKLFSLGVGLFGVVSVHLLYNVIYERAIYQHFINSQNGDKEIFESEVGFVFLELFFAWIIVEVIMTMSFQEASLVPLPKKQVAFCGFFWTISSILYTYSTFEISYISCLIHKTFSFSIVNLITFLFGNFFIQNRLIKRIDFILSLILLLGNLCFWIYADQQWFFSENKNGHLYAHSVVISGLIDTFLSLTQASICEKYQPSDIQLLHAVSRWAVFCSFIVLALKGDLFYTLTFFFSHYDFAVTILSLAGLYFVGQFCLYHITARMNVNVPLYIVSSKNTMMAHQSYGLSRHKLKSNQLIGMIISWTVIAVQFLLFARKQENNQIETMQFSQSNSVLDDFELRKIKPKTRDFT